MEISRYIIKTDIDNNKVLLYHTITTALIVLDHNKYSELFVNKNFADTDIVSQLRKLGFIVDSNEDDLQTLDAIRKTDLDNRVQVVTIFTTTNCNARCYYCFENGIKQFDMSQEVADKTIEFIKNFYPNKNLTIMWFGGEPLLRFDTIKYITLKLKDLGYELKTHITTNGSLVTQEMVDFFKEYYSVVSFQITIDEIGKKYGKIKRYIDCSEESAFDRVIQNVKLLNRNKIIISVRVNFVVAQVEKAKQVLLKLKELLAECISPTFYLYLSPLSLRGDCGFSCELSEGQEHPMINLMKFQIEQGWPLNSRVQKNEERTLLAAFGLIPSSNSCGMSTRKRIVINADGNLYKCHRMAGIEKYICGNVVDGIDEKSPNYQYFRNETITDEGCKRCAVLPICQGGCRSRKIFYGEQQKCTPIKNIRSELLKLYYEELKKSNN